MFKRLTILRHSIFDIRYSTFSIRSWRRLGSELLWVSLGQGLAACGAVVGVRLLTQVLLPETYGELALGLTAATLVQQLLFGPLGASLLRFFAPAQEAGEVRALVRALRTMNGQIVALVVTGGLCLAVGLGVAGHGRWVGLVLAAFLFSLMMGSTTVVGSMQNAARQRVVVAVHDGLSQWLRFLAALALIWWWGAASAVAMVGFVLGSAGVLASQYVFFRRKIVDPLESAGEPAPVDVARWAGQMRRYAWPFATWGVFTWVQMASDRWALQTFASTSAVGLYAVLYQLGYYPVNLVSGLLVQLISPVIFSRAGSGVDAERLASSRRLSHWLLVATVGLAALAWVLTYLLHSQIFALLVAPQYRGVSALLPWAVLSGGLFAAGQVALLAVLSGTETQHLLIPKIVTALLGIALNVVGAKWLGVPGVVFAGLTFSIVYFFWSLLLARRLPPGAGASRCECEA